MATKKSADRSANVAAVQVTEAVAGTIAYTRFAFPFSIMDKMALTISRIEYWMTGLTGFNSAADFVTAALIASNSIQDIQNQADPGLIDSARVLRSDLGVAASGVLIYQPYVKDFSALPGGGIMVAPSPLVAAVQGSGLAAVVGCWLKVFYTYQQLSTDEYWELVESRRIITS